MKLNKECWWEMKKLEDNQQVKTDGKEKLLIN